MEECQQNDICKFSLLPDPEDDHQTKEWGKFMCYLRERKKAGVVEFRSVTFHILAPESQSYPAVVLYETVLKDSRVCKKMEGVSGRSNTSEETCDNIPHTKEMKSSRKRHGLVAESSACNSVENGPIILDPAVKKKTSTLASNFVKTSPSYLKTLSQTHGGWIFGAIAELIDNSRDAGASRTVSFLSQSFNENKINLEIPVVAYYKKGQYMEFDLNVQSKRAAEYNLNAIKEYSPFNEYVIGEKICLFGEEGTGTQIFIWNLDRWGADYTLEWNSEKTDENPVGHDNRDILIRSKRVRSRPGQTSSNVPLDYSLKAYLEVMFLNPQMRITVQGCSVITCHLEKSLDKKAVISDEIMGRTIHLTLGRSDVEWDRVNCGIFLYWHGRLIEDDEDGNTWVLNSKQGFQDCEMYAKLEEWLGRKIDEYWNTNFDNLELRNGGELTEAVNDWVQCASCRKWRVLNPNFNTESLPLEWFCHMAPFNGKCDIPEQQMEVGVITVSEKISGHNKLAQPVVENVRQDEDVKNVKLIPPSTENKGKPSSDATSCEDELGDDFLQGGSDTPRPPLKRLLRGGIKATVRNRGGCESTG
uniref:Uncharacterized protein n=1 Tax=Avena sativa TaxID=4498 RepID=A0ACD5TZY2_AVESA